MATFQPPEMYNRFHNHEFDIDYIIPSDEQIPELEAQKMMDENIHQEMERLFAIWKTRKENKDWKDDETAKKIELFKNLRRPGSEIVLWRANLSKGEEHQ